MNYRLWKVEYNEEYEMTKENYTFCQSKTELIEKMKRALKVEDIEDIVLLIPQNQNQP